MLDLQHCERHSSVYCRMPHEVYIHTHLHYPRKFAKLTKHFCLNALLYSRDLVRLSCPVRELAHSASWIVVSTLQRPIQMQHKHFGERSIGEFRISYYIWSLFLIRNSKEKEDSPNCSLIHPGSL